ncbi:MAG: hypothetical protein HY235_24350 [Acidobacteria bacterium]|nr:hypothetical protein [Acidobacteriota bacterium]
MRPINKRKLELGNNNSSSSSNNNENNNIIITTTTSSIADRSIGARSLECYKIGLAKGSLHAETRERSPVHVRRNRGNVAIKV